MEDKPKLIFAEGVKVFKPRDGAPQSIKANVVIDVKQLLAFALQHELENIIRLDLRKSEAKGTLYFTLNTWKPTATPRTDKPDISKETVDEQGYPMPF